MARLSALGGVTLVVLCRKPGFRRAGQAHPARAIYPPGHFTVDQIEAMATEPLLQLVPDETEIVGGEGAAGSAAPGGPVPQPQPTGTLDPGGHAIVAVGDDSPSAGTTGDGLAATGTASVPSTDAPREDGGTGGDVGASTDGPAAGAASTPAPAGTGGDNQAAPPQPPSEGVSGDAPRASGAAARRSGGKKGG